MRIERILESFFDAKNLAVFFFLVSCLLVLQIRETDWELEACTRWSNEAYDRLSPSAKRDLRGEFQLHIDMLDQLSVGDPARDPAY